jgi:hypothetical protein
VVVEEGNVVDANTFSCLTPDLNTLCICKKTECSSQIECAVCGGCPQAVKFLITIYTELRKDAGVPHQIKVRSVERKGNEDVLYEHLLF